MILREMDLFAAFVHLAVVMTLRFDSTPMRSNIDWFNLVSFIGKTVYLR